MSPVPLIAMKRWIIERKALFLRQMQKKACVMPGLSVNSRPADIGV